MTASSDELVGSAAIPLDPWEALGRDAELDLFRAARLPEDWMPYARAMRWNFPPTEPLPDSPIVLRVGGAAPPRTHAELKRASDLDVGLDLQVEAGFDLRSLEYVVSTIRFLSVGTTGQLAGLEVLASATCLQQLTIDAKPSSPAMLPGLPSLERAFVPGALVALVARSPRLREFAVELGRIDWGDDFTVVGPVESASISNAVGLRNLPRFSQPLTLKILRIQKAPMLDLDRLPESVDLEWLEVLDVGELLGLQRLRGMSRLRQVTLDRVQSAPTSAGADPIAVKTLSLKRSDPALSTFFRK